MCRIMINDSYNWLLDSASVLVDNHRRGTVMASSVFQIKNRGTSSAVCGLGARTAPQTGAHLHLRHTLINIEKQRNERVNKRFTSCEYIQSVVQAHRVEPLIKVSSCMKLRNPPNLNTKRRSIRGFETVFETFGERNDHNYTIARLDALAV